LTQANPIHPEHIKFCPNFQMNITSTKTRMMGLSNGEGLVILAWLV